VALVFPVLAGVVVGLLFNGKLSRFAALPLRAPWLFLLAIVIQVIAFPFGVLPWRTGQTTATLLWLASFALLVAAATVNRKIRGVPLVAVGLLSNVAAVLANGGTMPVLPEAMHTAGRVDPMVANSTADATPNLPLLVDRWAAPDWIPYANVYSIGDVLIAVGAVVIVLAAMGARLPRLTAVRGPA
jgi:Family of unknown function (DUF5317)